VNSRIVVVDRLRDEGGTALALGFYCNAIRGLLIVAFPS